jgi:hypothetical protein
MSRPVLLLNLLLLVLITAGAMELRRRWQDARLREAQVLAAGRANAAQQTVVSPPPPTPPSKLQAMQYFEVAERFLFSRDRNPTVVIEKKAEPPPKPMPDFPGVHGVMDIGMGPTVFMSTGSAPQQGYKVGDKIGEFKLIAASQTELTFEWEDKRITKSIDDLRVSTREAAPSSARQNVPGVVANAMASVGVPVTPPKPPEPGRVAPGADIGGGRRGCLPNDTSPGGTIAEGYKKTSYTYAFGPICFWEPVR